MAEMTPEQQAEYAYDFGVARSDLPKDAQLVNDRLVEERAGVRTPAPGSQAEREAASGPVAAVNEAVKMWEDRARFLLMIAMVLGCIVGVFFVSETANVATDTPPPPPSQTWETVSALGALAAGIGALVSGIAAVLALRAAARARNATAVPVERSSAKRTSKRPLGTLVGIGTLVSGIAVLVLRISRNATAASVRKSSPKRAPKR